MFPIAATKLEDLSPDLQGLVLAIVNKAQPQSNPFLLGVPDVGTPDLAAAVAQSLKGRKPVVVAFDRLMETLPGYAEAAQRNPALAMADYAAPARSAGYRLLQMLLEKRANIIFGHSGDNAQHMLLLRYATAIGYKVSLCPAATQPELNDLLPAYRALGATLYEINAADEDDADSRAGFETLGERIAKAI